MDAQLKTEWVKALRSGKYKQGHSSFESDNKFCCLGVLCNIAGLGTTSSDGTNNWDGIFPIINAWDVIDELWHRNDGTYAWRNNAQTFSEIADYIEQNIPASEVNDDR